MWIKSRNENFIEKENLIISNGYIGVAHIMETRDNYILTVHRIRSKSQPAYKKLQPVLFMHGLAMTGGDFIELGPNNALPYLLADLGYECWLGNSRGTDYSLGHRFISNDTKEFWDFSFHEIGLFDLPAMIDFVLSYSRARKLFYICHSQGCSALMVLISLQPHYNEKIFEAHLYSPAVFMKNSERQIYIFFETPINAFASLTKRYDILSKIPYLFMLTFLTDVFCHTDLITIEFCKFVYKLVCGFNENGTETDMNNMALMMRLLPRAVSLKQIVHFSQLLHTERFLHYNYGEKNIEIYGQNEPPEYDLRNVQIRIYIYAGKNDLLINLKDLEHFRDILPNVKRFKVLENYNHCDFNYGINSKKLVYDFIIKSILKYKK
ncbi:hypothetical protein PVAND_017520 [Polypedilum vanderplanki]|uniref:Lipase n=1 Tax=Polypedilum vanderplanki TaxID=319348 RepID=A0A9J6BIJ2_POLVA|nr:hypothetical protein PVAND_017520 [Polypedilum vanderplanki]